MRRNELEARVLTLADQAFPYRAEDSAIELKAVLPQDRHQMARQLAGQANAAHGDTIIWVFGIDEKTGPVGIEPFETGELMNQLQERFASPMPDLDQCVVTQIGELRLQAMSFLTDRAPYVVKNPLFGTKGVSIEREVPWRAGDVTRTASRDQLLRLLASAVSRPTIYFREATVKRYFATNTMGEAVQERWRATIEMFIVPPRNETLVFPTSLVRCALEGNTLGRIYLYDYRFGTSAYRDGAAPPISVSDTEIIVRDAGSVTMLAAVEKEELLSYENEDDTLSLKLRLVPVRAEWAALFEAPCAGGTDDESQKTPRAGEWIYYGGPYDKDIVRFVARDEHE